VGLAPRCACVARARARRCRRRSPDRGRVGRLGGVHRRRRASIRRPSRSRGRGPLARRLYGAARLRSHPRRPARPRRWDDPGARGALRRLVGERRLRGERIRRRFLPRCSAGAGGRSEATTTQRSPEGTPGAMAARGLARDADEVPPVPRRPNVSAGVGTTPRPATASASSPTRWTAATTSASAVRSSWRRGSRRTPRRLAEPAGCSTRRTSRALPEPSVDRTVAPSSASPTGNRSQPLATVRRA
jgi:hypothetical protein